MTYLLTAASNNFRDPHHYDYDPFWSTPYDPEKKRQKYDLTLPRLAGSNPFQNPRTFRRRPAFPQYDTGSSITPTSSARAPDRFVPYRRSPDSITQNFRANKDPHKLSPSERLVRSNSASPDAFCPRRIVPSPNTQVNRAGSSGPVNSTSRGGG